MSTLQQWPILILSSPPSCRHRHGWKKNKIKRKKRVATGRRDETKEKPTVQAATCPSLKGLGHRSARFAQTAVICCSAFQSV